MFNGLIELSAWQAVAVALGFTHVTIASVTIFLHRHQAHRALDLHPIPSHFFRFWLWMSTGMVTREWVAIHRKHHAKCETEKDPHSPQVKGIKKVFFEGAELYRAEAKNEETIRRYSHGTPDDWLERNLYLRYSGVGLRLMLIINVILFGPIGLTIWAVQMIWIPITAAGIINGIGHYWGYRNVEPPDASTNIVPWGIIIGGEELHNNHHAFASSAKLSYKWWEFDIGWMYIRILESLGMARVKKLPPRPMIEPGKVKVDGDTLHAVLSNRLQIMSNYAKSVSAQVYAEELRRVADEASRRLLVPARALLVREDSLMTDELKARLESALEQSKALATVYEYRQRLQKIWKDRSATQESLVQSLQEWCKQAEQTGIRSLQEFARRLPTYTLQAA